jgi:hypothetical protein
MKLVQLEVREWTELLATFFAPPHNGKDVASFAAQMNEARKLAGKSEFKANTFANKASDERKAALREGREPGKRPACDTLHAPNAKRVHAREYEAVEKQLCAYLELRAQATKATKIGVPWTSLAARCIKWAQQLYDEEKASKFKCSAGWLSSVLKRGNCNYVSLEAGDADAETELAGMTDIKQQIALMCEHHGIEPSCIVSAGPTRLHYGQLPNIVFTKKNDRFSPQGIKRLQTKESITVMVCVTADGDKAPLAVIATGKSPPCFTLVDEPPLAYISQPRAWVDEDLTIRWINDVLMPWHRERKGPDSWLLLLLENCPAHARAESHPQYPKKGLKTIVVPANLTRRQPVDQGLTWSLKCGYKFAMLRELVSLAEDTPRYEAAFKAGRAKPIALRGLHYGFKAHILDAMLILDEVWRSASKDNVIQSWRLADFLPDAMTVGNADGDGAAERPLNRGAPKLSMELCGVFCDMMRTLSAKAAAAPAMLMPALKGSLCAEPSFRDVSDADLAEAMETWMALEDHPAMRHADLENALTAMDASFDGVPEVEEQEDGLAMEVETTPVSLVEVEAAFLTLHAYCQQSEGMAEAAVHLTRSEHLLRCHLQSGSRNRARTAPFPFPNDLLRIQASESD